MELRLLLSPDSDCVSMPMDSFTPELTRLVGRDKRRSRSTSERSGLFGVSWKISKQFGERLAFKLALERNSVGNKLSELLAINHLFGKFNDWR